MKKVSIALFTLAVLAASLFCSCDRQEKIQMEFQRTSPILQGAGDGSTIPCDGKVRYSTCYSILSEGSLVNGSYFFALKVDTSPYQRLEVPCECDSIEYCIKFTLPPEASLRIAVGHQDLPPGQCTLLDFDGFNSYFGHQSSLGSPSDPLVQEVCFTGTDQVVFRIPQQLLSQFDLSSIILSVSGLCIIDHISTPKVNDTTEYPCRL